MKFLLISGAQFRFAEVDDDFLDLARELERHIVVQVHRRARVFAHVEGFIQGEAEGHGPVDPPLGDLLAVHADRAGAAFADAAAVILEVEDNGVLAGLQGILGRDAVVGDIRHVVMENRLAVLEHQRVAAGQSALRDQHALLVALGEDHIRGDAERLVLDVGRRTFGDALHGSGSR